MSSMTRSLTADEASSVWFARMPISVLFQRLCDPHPPGYYFLLKIWLLGGDQEFWLRFLSGATFIFSLALAFRFARLVFSPQVASLVLFFLSVNPLLIGYAAETRMYALAQLFALLFALSAWKLLTAPRANVFRVVLFVATGWFALWMDYASWPIWWGVQLLWLIKGHAHPQRWLTAQIVLLLPIFYWWIGSAQWIALANSYPAIFLIAQAHRFGVSLPLSLAQAILGGGIILCVVVTGIFALFWARFSRLLTSTSILLGILISWLFLLIFAAQPGLFTVKRQFVVPLPFFAVAVSWALLTIQTRLDFSRKLRWLFALRFWKRFVFVASFLITILALTRQMEHEPWKSHVDSLVHPVDSKLVGVIWVDELAVPVFDFYARQGSFGNFAPVWAILRGAEKSTLPSFVPQSNGILTILWAENQYRYLPSALPDNFLQFYRLVNFVIDHGVGLYTFQFQPSSFASQNPFPNPFLTQRWGELLPSPLDQCGVR